MAINHRHVVGLDIGTSKVVAIVGETGASGNVEVIGLGVVAARGVRRGSVIDHEATVESIRHAVSEAELTSGINIDAARVALSGTHIKSFNSRGSLAVAGNNTPVTPDGIRLAIEVAHADTLPEGRDILHVVPEDDVVDDDTVHNPIGRQPVVNVHIVTISSATAREIVTCVNEAGVAVQELVFGLLAAGMAVLTVNEKELGVVLVDIGAGTTDIAIFERGCLRHTAVVAIGGDHFTHDVAVGLRTSIQDAEAIKRSVGCSWSTIVGEDEVVNVTTAGGRSMRAMSRRALSDMMRPRIEEIFRLVRDEVCRAGCEQVLNSGVIITGGSADLAGIVRMADQILEMPARRGVPTPTGRLATQLRHPSFATAVGILVR